MQRTRRKFQETAMDVRGYPTGPIDAKGAFTSEIDLSPIIKPGPLNTVAEADRPHIVDQPGMRHKYLPLRHDPATGAISSGGRYLFRGYEDATKFRDFLEAKVFPSEQTTFWKRPFFISTVRFAWCVTGAHDLAPITTHDLNRFERYSVGRHTGHRRASGHHRQIWRLNRVARPVAGVT